MRRAATAPAMSWAVLNLLYLSACGGATGGAAPDQGQPDSSPPDSSGGDRLAAADLLAREPRHTDATAGECEVLGNKLRLTMKVSNVDLTSTDPQKVTGPTGVVGFTGTAEGYRYFLGRHGEQKDGAFTEARAYSASQYPYHLLLQIWPSSSGAACEGNSQCETYFGLSGEWLIVTVTAPTSGTFIVGNLTHDANCWAERESGPPDISKCSIIGGTAYGCFKVD